MMDLPKVYSHKDVEEKWYKIWEESGFFSPDGPAGSLQDAKSKTFVIVIPPPNITGSLHMGHALDNTLQDILMRYKRMRGYAALWIPGTDHAGIATQNVVEKQMAKEGIKKEQIGRDAFVKRVWEWKEQYGGTIVRQLRCLGASLDWKRERFTMDAGLSSAVRKAFVSLYKEGLIYRGKRMINWCPRCKTAISDIEVEHENKKGSLWFIKYPIEKSQIPNPKSQSNPKSQFSKSQTEADYVVVATTRPETMLGDTAVAVNSGDERYKRFIGKTLILPLVNRRIPIIADDFVQMEFGTGAVKVTPAHDPNDFEIGLRHNLQKINIFTQNAHIVLSDFNDGERALLSDLEGLDRDKAREKIVEELDRQGLLLKAEDYENAIGKCYRCKTVIEPYLSDQWFVKVAPLAEKAIAAVESGDIQFMPKRWEKVYIDWMTNLRDWCISRQIWWGHRIPVWYCSCGETIVAEEDPKNCTKCAASSLTQDSDVLDTWFSSSLWPFSTLGWPEQTDDLKTYYPTTVLITGYDIITFWVSKMIMMGLKFMGKRPFEKVYIHGLIRDVTGKKMSKSLGNVIDPLEVINHVGADALRFALTSLATSGGQDLKLSEEKITEGRNFANKIWNAARFVLMQGASSVGEIDARALSPADKWILSRYNETVKKITHLLDNFEFGEAARSLYEFIWSQFCDWYVEMSKQSLDISNPKSPPASLREALRAGQIPNPKCFDRLSIPSAVEGQIPNSKSQKSEQEKENTIKVLRHVLEGTMKLLHPFMPFETEEIYHYLGFEGTIMLSDWPREGEALIDKKADSKMNIIIEIIRAIRNIRAEMNVASNRNINVLISAPDLKQDIEEALPYIKNLVKADIVEIHEVIKEKPAQSASAIISGIEIYVPLEGLIDFEKELRRLEKSSVEMAGLIQKTQEKLSNRNFVERAKPELVEEEKGKLREYLSKKKILDNRVGMLRKG